MAYRVVGARDMLSAARDKFSTSSGVDTPSTTQLVPLRSVKKHGISYSQAKRHDLCDPRDKFSKYLHELIYFMIPYCPGMDPQENWTTRSKKCHILHDKGNTPYILLFYHLYNLVSHMLSLLNVLDKLVMVTLWTHTIAKNGYLRLRPIWLN